MLVEEGGVGLEEGANEGRGCCAGGVGVEDGFEALASASMFFGVFFLFVGFAFVPGVAWWGFVEVVISDKYLILLHFKNR